MNKVGKKYRCKNCEIDIDEDEVCELDGTTLWEDCCDEDEDL